MVQSLLVQKKMKTDKIIFFTIGIILLSSVTFADFGWFGGPVSPPPHQGGGGGDIIIGEILGNFSKTIYTGADTNGTNGDTNRWLWLNNLNRSSNEIVVVDNYLLMEGIDYTIDHNDTNSSIVFLNKIFDTQNIMVQYIIASDIELTSNYEDFYGAVLTGGDGDFFRTKILGNTGIINCNLVTVDNFVLMETIDYNLTTNETNAVLTLFNKIYNTQYITVRYYSE